MQGAPIWSRTFPAAGMAPTVIAYNEVYNAIQNGVIAAGENEAAGVEQMKFYEVGAEPRDDRSTPSPSGRSASPARPSSKLPADLQAAIVQGGQGGRRLRPPDRVERGRAEARRAGEGRQAEARRRSPTATQMKKLVDPVMAAYAKEIGADEILAEDQRHQVARRGRGGRPAAAAGPSLQGAHARASSGARGWWRTLDRLVRRAARRGCWSSAIADADHPGHACRSSRATPTLIPSYIWTEEMARFLFIWMIMLGAMIGVREGTHFEVDVWPRLGPRGERGAASSSAASCVLVFALRLRLVRHRVHRVRLEPHLGAGRAAAVADPHRLAARRRHLARLPRRADASTTCACSPGGRAMMGGAVLSPGDGEPHPVRRVLRAAGAARAGRVRARPRLPADPADRAAPVADELDAGDLQRLQLVHPARGAVLPADRQPDERRRHHRPAGAAVARAWSAISPAAWRRSTWCCRSSSPASPARRPPTPRASRRSSSRRSARRATTTASRWRSPRSRRCWR